MILRQVNSARPPVGRRAFTLVELLVVIAIIGVLVALLLPAVQAAREAARRMSCTNNLKNIALSIQNFHGAANKFPQGIHYNGNGCQVPSKFCGIPRTGKGWIVDVLPYMEQAPLHDSLRPGFESTANFSKTAETGMALPEIRESMQTQLPVLTCPSDSAEHLRTDQFWWEDREVATTNYKGMIGDNVYVWQNSRWKEDQPNPNAPKRNGYYDCHGGMRDVAVNNYGAEEECSGLLWRNNYGWDITMRKITDGTSNTIVVGESLVDQDLHGAALFSDGDWAGAYQPLNYFIPDPEDLRDDFADVRGFRSNHPGGVQFAMVDGSVQYLQEDVEHQVYRALSTKSNGEVINDVF